MVKLKLLSVVFLLFKMIYGILASSHWVVTEKGLIQPLFDSPFQMRVPNDLMGFLEQERRLKEIDGIYKTLKDFVFDKPFLEGSAAMPSKVHKTSYYCEKTTIPIDDIDLYMSIAADGSDRDGIKLVDFFADNSLRNIYGTEVPNCEKSSSLPFSMFTFEHLKAMVQRQNLSLAPEHSLHEWLLPGTSVTSFGHQVALGLLHNSTSWLHYNLAAIYWRIKGEATKALECSRRAVHFAPRQYRDISLLNMGSIFHQTKNYADAAIVLHAAIDHDPLQPANYFALGNVYAVLEDYNQSVACYDNVLKLKPSFKQARINKYAVLCKAHHINELLELNDAIQNKYAEVRDFLKLKEDWQKLEEKLMNELAPLGFKSFGNVDGDVSDYSNTNSENEKEDATSPETWQIRSSSRMFSNMLESHQTFNPFEIVISIQMLLKNLESELRKLSPRYKLTDDFALVKMNERNEYSVNVKKINGETSADASVSDNPVDVTNLESVLVPPLTFYMSDVPDDYEAEIDKKNDENFDIARKTLQTKYPPTTKISRIKQDFDKQSDWPSQEECDLWAPLITKRVGKMGEPLELLPLYLPVENKGYDTKRILSENIMLTFEVEHPLPWYPPLCCSEVQPNIRTSYLPSALLIKSKSSPSFPTENKLRQILISFVTDSNVDSNKHIQEAEIGQRILTAIKKSAAPKWVLYTLASLYWRVRGHVQNTLDCLLCAIELTPDSTKDVPLTSLGSVLYELGYIEDSIKVSAEAYTINKIEPTTNFLLSMLHKSKNNVLGQLYHMKQVIRVDPDFMQGWAYTLLRGWHCIAKSIMKLKFSNVEAATKAKSPDICSDISKEKIKDDPESIGGDMMGMICTAGGETCQPANIQCYKTDTQSSEDEYVSYSMMRDVVEKNFPEQTELHCISTSDDRVLGGNEKGTTATCKLKKVDHSADKKMSSSDKVSSEFTEKSPLIMTIKTERPHQEQQESDEKKDKIRGKFQLRLVPPEDLDKDIKELGYMKVDGETYDIANLESWVTKMHIYDQSLSLQLSDDICAKMEKVDVFKSSSFWNAYSQRDFFDTVQSLLPEKYSGSDLILKPYCTAAQDDFVLDALGSENLPPLPQYSTHNFLSLLRRVTGDHDSSLNDLGGKIAEALKINHASWIPNFLAAIFWRIEGNPDMVVACLRQSLYLAPEREKDVSLIGLSFFFQWLGMNDDSMKSAKMAHKKRPDFAVNLFHIAMVHAHMGELEHAIHILRKVIRQDSAFIIAEHSINELLCLLLFGLNDFLKEGTLSSLLKVFL